VGHSGSTVGRYILIYTRQGRAGRVEGMQRVSCESRGDVKDRHNEIRIRPRKPDGVRVSSLVPRPVETVRCPDPARERAGRVRRMSAWIESDWSRTMSNARVLVSSCAANGALSLTVTPPCVVRCLAPLVSFARSTYHLTANVSYSSFLL
jgi:hypothetical protein